MKKICFYLSIFNFLGAIAMSSQGNLDATLGYSLFTIITVIISKDVFKSLFNKLITRYSNHKSREEDNQTNKNTDSDESLYGSYNNEAIVKKYNRLLYKLNRHDTNEILEYCIDLEEINGFYCSLPDSKKILVENPENLNYIIKQAINKKFNNICENESKYDLLKAFYDELNYCKKRYPKYNKIFTTEILKIENILEQSIDKNI